jgi:hypothetical protein
VLIAIAQIVALLVIITQYAGNSFADHFCSHKSVMESFPLAIKRDFPFVISDGVNQDIFHHQYSLFFLDGVQPPITSNASQIFLTSHPSGTSPKSVPLSTSSTFSYHGNLYSTNHCL